MTGGTAVTVGAGLHNVSTATVTTLALDPTGDVDNDGLATFPGARGKVFGAIVESLGSTPAQIVVERAVY